MKPRAILLLLLVLLLAGSTAWMWHTRTRDPAKTVPQTIDYRLDLNTASAPDLAALPEIGPNLAQRIVEYRDQHGPFARVEELTHVKGIGPKILEQVRPYLVLGTTTRPG